MKDFTPTQLRHIANHSRNRLARALALHMLETINERKWK